MICTYCGANNSDEALFCQKCGKQLEAINKDNSTLLATPSIPASPYESSPYTSYGSSKPIYPPPPPFATPGSISNPYEKQPPYRAQTNRMYLIVIVVLVVMLIVGGVFVGILVGKGNTQVNTQGNSNQPGNIPINNATTTDALPTPTATATTTSSPFPQPGAILYEENGSDNWQGWQSGIGWSVSNGMLINDGMHTAPWLGPQIVAPFTVPVQDYEVDVTVQIVGSTRCFGITTRGTFIGNRDSWRGYQGSVNLNGGCEFSNGLGILDDVSPSLGYTPYSIDNAYHTYRLAVKGSTISFSVDGGPTVQATNSKVSSGGQVGLWSVYLQLNISSLKIIAL